MALRNVVRSIRRATTTTSIILRNFTRIAAATPATNAAPAPGELDATLTFNEVWNRLEERVGVQNMRFPREILWLGGAPGSGKTTNTRFIMRERGYTAPPIVVSELLTTPEANAIKAKGGMVGDREVLEVLLSILLKPVYHTGLVVDGFPRTKVQAEVTQLLFERMRSLHRTYENDAVLRDSFPRPVFRICMLFVELKESVERQLKRGRQAVIHNEKIRDQGEGKAMEIRATDFDEELARQRYLVFRKTTYAALEGLAQHFVYNVVDASGNLPQVEANIKNEMKYQSSLELNPDTHAQIRDLPKASEVILHTRQALVQRLDGYQHDHASLLKQMVKVLVDEFFPVIRLHALAGRCTITTRNPALVKDPMAVRIAMDVLSDRGFHVTWEEASLPTVDGTKLDLKSAIRFRLEWDRPRFRSSV